MRKLDKQLVIPFVIISAILIIIGIFEYRSDIKRAQLIQSHESDSDNVIIIDNWVHNNIGPYTTYKRYDLNVKVKYWDMEYSLYLLDIESNNNDGDEYIIMITDECPSMNILNFKSFKRGPDFY